MGHYFAKIALGHLIRNRKVILINMLHKYQIHISYLQVYLAIFVANDQDMMSLEDNLVLNLKDTFGKIWYLRASSKPSLPRAITHSTQHNMNICRSKSNHS